jgi:hypothetical protein
MHLGTVPVHEVALRLLTEAKEDAKRSFKDRVRAQVQLGHEKHGQSCTRRSCWSTGNCSKKENDLRQSIL